MLSKNNVSPENNISPIKYETPPLVCPGVCIVFIICSPIWKIWPSSIKVTFKGFIDKIKYSEFNGKTVVAIIDYKTGNPNLNINNIPYGLDMQLPVYIYLLKNSNDLNNVKIGGFYLQKILNNTIDRQERINSLKLQGYSNSNENILEKVDSSYMDSKVIKSMKVSNNGFYAYSKVISDENIDKLSNLVWNSLIIGPNTLPTTLKLGFTVKFM